MSFDINSLLSKTNEKQVVGVALTPGIGLEAAILNKENSEVVAYGKREVAYNFSIREIQDIGQFKQELKSLMTELNVQPKTPVYFVLPNILFDFMEYPPDMNKDAVNMMVLSKAEEHYLFKREEPQSGWSELASKDARDQKRIVFTSIQKNTVDLIKTTVNEDLNLSLIGIESAYSATLRGLFVGKYIEDVVLEESSWTVMLININSYTLFQMNGDNIVSYKESPLALKSFSMEEAYQAIVSSSSQDLASYSSSKLFVISQTDDISADVLKRELRFDKEIIAINSNKFSKEPIMQVTSAADYESTKYLTLSVVGAASPKADFRICLNVMQDDPDIAVGLYKIPVNGKVYELTAAQCSKFLLIAFACILGFYLVIIGLFVTLKTTSESKLEEINQQVSEKNKTIEELQKAEQENAKQDDLSVEVDMTSVIDEIANINVGAIKFYDSIATDIPKNIWLTKYYNRNKDKNEIVIRGIAENIVDVYEYYKNLKILSPQSDIKLADLKVVTSDGNENQEDLFKDLNVNVDTDRLYSFEIANTSIGEMEMVASSDTANENNIISSPMRQVTEEMSKKMEDLSQQMVETK